MLRFEVMYMGSATGTAPTASPRPPQNNNNNNNTTQKKKNNVTGARRVPGFRYCVGLTRIRRSIGAESGATPNGEGSQAREDPGKPYLGEAKKRQDRRGGSNGVSFLGGFPPALYRGASTIDRVRCSAGGVPALNESTGSGPFQRDSQRRTSRELRLEVTWHRYSGAFNKEPFPQPAYPI